MPATATPLGRKPECAVLGWAVDEARAGRGSVFVVHGEPGIGKSALLEYAAAHASDCVVARAAGAEAEAELPLAGLQQLLGATLLAGADRLPAPQRDAVRIAFGLREGPVPDGMLVGLAALGLLTNAAGQQPLLCIVDDAQWLDRASLQILSFVARRLAGEHIAMVFALREPGSVHELEGLPQLTLGGLSEHHAGRLLDSVVAGQLDPRVRERIVAESRGNPLALLELPRALTPGELAGGFGLPAEGAAGRLELSFVRRIEVLPAGARQVLVAAAAEPTGDVTLLLRALRTLGAGPDAVAAAEGLIELGASVRFRHPLVRSAAYRAASPQERRTVHAALAQATDPGAEPDRRAWHRAHATAVPDEEIAAALERSASRAGPAAAAALIERAAELTPDPATRGARCLAAAQATFDAGAPQAAETLLATATRCPLGELEHARLDRLRARIAFTPALLSAAARGLERLDPALARVTHLEALWAAVRSGHDEDVLAAAAAAADDGSERAADRLLTGLTTRLARGYAPALPALERALAAFLDEGFSGGNIAWCWLAYLVAMDLWDDDACAAIAGLAREGGASVLPFALSCSAAAELFAGRFAAAGSLLREPSAITDLSVLIEAWRGDRVRTAELRDAASARGERLAIEVGEWALATLHLGHGEYEEAAAAARRAHDHEGLGFGVWVLPELIEAAVRGGDRALAERALAQLEERSSLRATRWACGIAARSRALLSEGDEADALYREAIEQLGGSRVAVHHARARLVYGEWLRRERRRVDARAQLKAALDAFDAMGASAFAERARRELTATGAIVRRRTVETRDELTPQETQIARMAGEGLTNPEIGAQLFLSQRTIEWHMRKILAKLDISSRRELTRTYDATAPAVT